MRDINEKQNARQFASGTSTMGLSRSIRILSHSFNCVFNLYIYKFLHWYYIYKSSNIFFVIHIKNENMYTMETYFPLSLCKKYICKKIVYLRMNDEFCLPLFQTKMNKLSSIFHFYFQIND